MKDQSKLDIWTAIIVASLLILTAWGNAVAMLIVSILGLVVYVWVSRKKIVRSGPLASIVGFVLAFVIAVVRLF